MRTRRRPSRRLSRRGTPREATDGVSLKLTRCAFLDDVESTLTCDSLLQAQVLNGQLGVACWDDVHFGLTMDHLHDKLWLLDWHMLASFILVYLIYCLSLHVVFFVSFLLALALAILESVIARCLSMCTAFILLVQIF